MRDVRVDAVRSNEDLARVCALMLEVFGAPSPHAVDARVALLAGGFCAAARAEERVVGGLLAFAGWDEDGPFQHSHVLAVLPELRGRGVGESLKRLHADWSLARGLERIRWTFDPLMVGNARFNLARLGAVGEQWIEDCYGLLEGKLDALARTGAGAPSDRLHVTWYLGGAPAPPAGGECLVRIPETGSAAGGESGIPSARDAVLELRAALAPRLAAGAKVVGVVETAEGWAYRVALPEGVE